MDDLQIPYLNVKVIVTSGDKETTYEMTKVQDFSVCLDHEEPDIDFSSSAYKIKSTPKVKNMTFSMKPLIDDKGLVVTATIKTLEA